MSHHESRPPTLLTLPSEIRLKIFTFALLPITGLTPTDSFNLLRSSRQIYYETRHLPPQLYPASLFYDSSTPQLQQLLPKLHQPWQLANLRRLEIRWLYPSQLGTFLNVGPHLQNPDRDFIWTSCEPSSEPAGPIFPFCEPLLNLDILKIYTADWMTRASASGWRRVAGPKDVQYGIPGPACGWLVALCQLRGFRQLELEFAEGDLVQEYWERGRFIEGLLRNFAEAMKARAVENGGAPEEGVLEWTLWHKWTPDECFGERITALRTRDLHLHGHPQWSRKDLETLRQGSACLHPRWTRGSAVVEGVAGGESYPEIDLPSFHVGELLGAPAGRERVCEHCREIGELILTK